MISNEMLRGAAMELSCTMTGTIETQRHQFSPEFEQKMATLIRKTTHPVRQQVLRYVAAVLIAVLTAFAGLYLLSPPVRAAVNGWVRSIFGDHLRYHSEQKTPSDITFDYYLPTEIGDYKFAATFGNDTETTHIYANSDGQQLSFTYIRGEYNAELFILDIQEYNYTCVPVNGFTVDLYISKNEKHSNSIVWYSEEENVLFCIDAYATEEYLIRYANMVEKILKS